MEDRELLEAAAKAAGIEYRDFSQFGLVIGEVHDSSCVGAFWNPLTDDGDALRLAVKLNLSVRVYGANTMCYDMRDNFLGDHVDAEDPYAATRRAIVRAAAELAKQGA